MKFTERIANANERLKAAKVGVQIEQQGDRLVLRATLPPKPDSSKTTNHQQRIYLGVHANPHGLGVAEAEAKLVGAKVDAGKFEWTPYVRHAGNKPISVSQWATQFEEHYFSRRERNHKSETTWNGDYHKVLRRLPQQTPLTVELLKEAIISTAPDTKDRKRTCMVVGALARFAGLELETKSLAGKYNPKKTAVRELPTDEEIFRWWRKFKNLGWRWVYGLMATYGVRNHEAFRIDYERLAQGDPVLRVMNDTKTGYRLVWPFYPEWFDQFELAKVIVPPINLDRSNDRIGRHLSQYFRDDFGLPFKPYDLRHCWAVRTIEFLLPVELAAQQMGHSVEEHCETYHRWIRADHQQRVVDALMARAERPKPPQIPEHPTTD